jgi:GntR family transcriptional regulator, transcriptional repressor for pyruvate dehydrogenase complex
MEAGEDLGGIADASLPAAGSSLGVVFAPVRSQTAFEETVDRLGTAIKLGLLPPGTRLPAERELCERLGIARSTLRQALVALGQSGHVHALRGRGGGTFVADPLPPAAPPSSELMAQWRDVCDERRAIEVGIAQLAAERAQAHAVDALDRFVLGMDSNLHDFASYRHLDVRLHVGIAELTGSARLVALMTEVQGSMSSLISHIAHPPEVLDVSNDQHRRLVECLRRHDGTGAGREMAEHTRGTEYVLAGLLPGA